MAGLDRGQEIAPPGRTNAAPGWCHPAAKLIPYLFAVTTTFQLIAVLTYEPLQIGFDARLYAAASRAWLTGGNPWQVSDQGVYFAAPPPSLLLFAPFASVPDVVTTWVWVLGSVAVAIAAVRSLRAPAWWLLWWPVVSGCLVGSADIVVLGSLVISRQFGWVAPIAKAYAFLPLLSERRWVSAAIGATVLLLTFAVLPWSTFLASLPEVTQHLSSVAETTSVFGISPLFLIGVLAVLGVGLRRAGWLAVPVIWPWTQPHYLVMSIPAMSPVLAGAWSFPHPVVVLGGLIVDGAIYSPLRRFVEGKVAR